MNSVIKNPCQKYNNIEVKYKFGLSKLKNKFRIYQWTSPKYSQVHHKTTLQVVSANTTIRSQRTYNAHRNIQKQRI